MNNRTLKKIMACLALLSSYSINVHAKEKKEVKQNVQRNSTLKQLTPYGLGLGVLGISALAKRTLDQSTNKLHNINLQMESENEALQKAKSTHEGIEKEIKSKVTEAKKENVNTINIINNIQTDQFDKYGITDKDWNELVEKIKFLIPDEVAKAYYFGDLKTKKAISEKVADVIQKYSQYIDIDKDNSYAIEEMQKLDKLSETGQLENEGILEPIMAILSVAVDMISKLDMAGIKLFNENETNEEGLKNYFQKVVDYLIPTEGDAEKLKLAKFIKKALTIATKHYDNKKSLKELVQPLFGSKLSYDKFGEIFVKKLKKVIEMPD